jgi:hypothetical protein
MDCKIGSIRDNKKPVNVHLTSGFFVREKL